MTKQKTNVVVVNRNLQLPKYIWDALDEDAERCGRSGVKQLLALLTAYYNLGNTELDQEGLERMRLASIPLGHKHPQDDKNIIPTERIPHDLSPGQTFTPKPKKGGK